jgi:hypothetical protein
MELLTYIIQVGIIVSFMIGILCAVRNKSRIIMHVKSEIDKGKNINKK